MDFERLDALLKERHISRRKLASVLGINENKMSSAFKRKSGLSSDDLLKIAQYLEVNPYYLEGLTDNPYIKAARIADGAGGYTVSYMDRKEYEEARKTDLLVSFYMLNKDGQIEAVKRVEELTEIKRYRKED